MRIEWRNTLDEAARLALEAVSIHRLRSALAIFGIVIGVVTVVLTASVIVNVRNQVALLFRDLGTDNVFAFHLTGDPYVTPRPEEAGRRPLRVEYASEIARLASAVADAAAQIVVPTTEEGRVIVARAGIAESDTVLLEAATPSLFDIIGAEFARGRPFTDIEDRAGARVAVIGARVSRALFGGESPIGRTMTLAGESYVVVGELEERPGAIFGENRQDNVITLPAGTARRRFGEPDRVVLYVRARPGQRDACLRETETILRVLRGLPPEAPNDFTLSTADRIIATFDAIAARIGAAALALAAVSLVIGAVGVANVMFISVTERTREIGVRMALGARRRQVQLQFLIEAVALAVLGGVFGIAAAAVIGVTLSAVLAGFSAHPPVWAVAAALLTSIVTGVGAGYWPARQASRINPIDALRYE